MITEPRTGRTFSLFRRREGVVVGPLERALDTATTSRLVVVDGFVPGRDWLRISIWNSGATIEKLEWVRSNDSEAPFFAHVAGLTSVIGHADGAKFLRDYWLAGADATNKKTARLRAVFGNGLPPMGQKTQQRR